LRARKHGGDEIGTLIDGFNEMLAQIQQRDAALRGAHDDLEHRVAERTRELQQEISERKQAEKIVQQQLTRISLLNQITHAISERQDVQSILSIVLQQLQAHLPIVCGAFYLFDADKQTLWIASVAGVRSRESSGPFPRLMPLAEIEHGPLHDCLQARTVCLPDKSARGFPSLANESAEVIGSLVAVPLHVQGKLFGLLLAGRATENAFSSGECEFLKILGEQVALAGNHALLYTQLQSAYNELRETQQAVMQHERLRALGQMASGIAHDINNALSPVMGFAELLLHREPNLSASGRKYIEHICTSSDDIRHIVARLREFYRRRDEGHQLRPLHLNQLAAQAIELTRPRWRDMSQERGITISVQTDFSTALPPVQGIESEMREALINLILNAVDAVERGGTITIRTRVSGANGAEPSELALEVEDDGVGMDQETRKRCLEPFFSTKGARGTGLGLAMVYGIMERHDGRIEIVSQRGEGTRMRLIFPVVEPSSDLNKTAPVSDAPLPPLRLLFVDDEPLLRQLVREMMEHDGHKVSVADAGDTGFEEFRRARETSEPFDAVITDLGMPRMDGRKFSELLKKESPNTPIVMLTGWGTLMRAEGEKPAVDIVLSKPPKLQEIRRALHQVTRGAKATNRV
jgi:signal transduction histidine kinase/ActR/RegA family two-component response regulator